MYKHFKCVVKVVLVPLVVLYLITFFVIGMLLIAPVKLVNGIGLISGCFEFNSDRQHDVIMDWISRPYDLYRDW